MVTAQGRRILLIVLGKRYEDTAVEFKSNHWWTDVVLRRVLRFSEPSRSVTRLVNWPPHHSSAQRNKLKKKETVIGV